MTQYRPICGTHHGLARHQAAGEAPCGRCREGELRRRLDAERVPHRPTGTTPACMDITPEQARANFAKLARALATTPKGDTQ